MDDKHELTRDVRSLDEHVKVLPELCAGVRWLRDTKYVMTCYWSVKIRFSRFRVKQAEAAFRVLSANAAQFDHFAPSDWLIRNPSFLDGTDEGTLATLKRAERLFETFNRLLG